MSTQSISAVGRAPAAFSPTRSRWLPLPVILAGTFMVVLDFFIVNVALPSMQAHLHASAGAIEWVVAGYGLTNAVFLITGARLGDRLGRVRVFTVGLALFTLASAGCGLAGTPEILVVSRLRAGLRRGAADAQRPVDHRRPLRRRRSRQGAGRLRHDAWASPPCSGQLIGGILVQANPAGLGWRSCFLINIPIGLLRGAGGAARDPESRVPRSGGTAGPRRHGPGHPRPRPRSCCRWSRAARMAGRCGRGCRWPPRRSCSAPSALQQRRLAAPRRHAADAARAVRLARADRRAGRPDAVLERAGLVLPRAVAVPAARPRA